MLFAFLLASQVAHVTPVLQRQPKVRDTLAAFQTVKAPALAQWKASAADEADVRRVVDTYFARTDTGQMEAALSMYKATAIRDRRGWLAQRRQLVRKLGAGKRRITAVTWYVNPPGASQPGIFAAVDFVGHYPAAPVYCGYIALLRHGPGHYEVVRDEQNVVALSDGPFDPSQLAQLRASMCPS